LLVEKGQTQNTNNLKFKNGSDFKMVYIKK
jgi:hypothetical protein